MKKSNISLLNDLFDDNFSIFQLKNDFYSLRTNIKELEKALELACEHIDYVVTKDGAICSGLYNENKDKIVEYFKTKAKEIMKSDV